MEDNRLMILWKELESREKEIKEKYKNKEQLLLLTELNSIIIRVQQLILEK